MVLSARLVLRYLASVSSHRGHSNPLWQGGGSDQPAEPNQRRVVRGRKRSHAQDRDVPRQLCRRCSRFALKTHAPEGLGHSILTLGNALCYVGSLIVRLAQGLFSMIVLVVEHTREQPGMGGKYGREAVSAFKILGFV